MKKIIAITALSLSFLSLSMTNGHAQDVAIPSKDCDNGSDSSCPHSGGHATYIPSGGHGGTTEKPAKSEGFFSHFFSGFSSSESSSVSEGHTAGSVSEGHAGFGGMAGAHGGGE